MSKKRPYRYLLYLLLRVLQGLSLILPRTWLFGFAKVAGKTAWWSLPKERRRVIEHLSTAYGVEKSDREFERI